MNGTKEQKLQVQNIRFVSIGNLPKEHVVTAQRIKAGEALANLLRDNNAKLEVSA